MNWGSALTTATSYPESLGAFNPWTLSRLGHSSPAWDSLLRQWHSFHDSFPSASIVAPMVSLGNCQLGNTGFVGVLFLVYWMYENVHTTFTRVKMILPISPNVWAVCYSPTYLAPPSSGTLLHISQILYLYISKHTQVFLYLPSLAKFNYFEIFWWHIVHS